MSKLRVFIPAITYNAKGPLRADAIDIEVYNGLKETGGNLLEFKTSMATANQSHTLYKIYSTSSINGFYDFATVTTEVKPIPYNNGERMIGFSSSLNTNESANENFAIQSNGLGYVDIENLNTDLYIYIKLYSHVLDLKLLTDTSYILEDESSTNKSDDTYILIGEKTFMYNPATSGVAQLNLVEDPIYSKRMYYDIDNKESLFTLPLGDLGCYVYSNNIKLDYDRLNKCYVNSSGNVAITTESLWTSSKGMSFIADSKLNSTKASSLNWKFSDLGNYLYDESAQYTFKESKDCKISNFKTNNLSFLYLKEPLLKIDNISNKYLGGRYFIAGCMGLHQFQGDSNHGSHWVPKEHYEVNENVKLARYINQFNLVLEYGTSLKVLNSPITSYNSADQINLLFTVENLCKQIPGLNFLAFLTGGDPMTGGGDNYSKLALSLFKEDSLSKNDMLSAVVSSTSASIGTISQSNILSIRLSLSGDYNIHTRNVPNDRTMTHTTMLPLLLNNGFTISKDSNGIITKYAGPVAYVSFSWRPAINLDKSLITFPSASDYIIEPIIKTADASIGLYFDNNEYVPAVVNVKPSNLLSKNTGSLNSLIDIGMDENSLTNISNISGLTKSSFDEETLVYNFSGRTYTLKNLNILLHKETVYVLKVEGYRVCSIQNNHETRTYITIYYTDNSTDGDYIEKSLYVLPASDKTIKKITIHNVSRTDNSDAIFISSIGLFEVNLSIVSTLTSLIKSKLENGETIPRDLIIFPTLLVYEERNIRILDGGTTANELAINKVFNYPYRPSNKDLIKYRIEGIYYYSSGRFNTESINGSYPYMLNKYINNLEIRHL